MTPILPQVKNIVMLMLENRSLDNLLGWLYEGDQPEHVFPRNSPAVYDGLVAGRYSNPAKKFFGGVENYPVVPVPDDLGSDLDRVPAYDPYEPLKEDDDWYGVMNQLYGDANRISGLPNNDGPEPGMLGFLQDYYSTYMLELGGARHPVGLHARPDAGDQLAGQELRRERPVVLLGALADEPEPGVLTVRHVARPREQPRPHRGRAVRRHDGVQPAGHRRQELGLVLHRRVEGEQVLHRVHLPVDLQGRRQLGDRRHPDVHEAGQGAGSFPSSPISSRSGATARARSTSRAPTTTRRHVCVRRRSSWADVYNAIRQGPQWNETLFVVTFDEHGGTYDHRPPPKTINPGSQRGTSGFNFDRLGVRVPTILVSPFVEAGTVFRAPEGSSHPFDHTSLLKTLLLWAGVDAASAGMGARMPVAPTFEGVLADDHVNVHAARPEVAEAAAAEPDEGLVNHLLEGVPFAATKAIINAADDVAAVEAGVSRYRADPEAFEASLDPGPG